MSQSSIGKAVRYGLIAGLVAASVSAIGMVETFNERDIITDILTLGQVLLYSTPIIAGYLAIRTDDDQQLSAGPALVNGVVAGLMTAVPVVGVPNDLRGKVERVEPLDLDVFVQVPPKGIHWDDRLAAQVDMGKLG